MASSAISATDSEERAVDAVRAVLPAGVSVTVRGRHRAGTDPIDDLVVNGHELQVEWIGEGRLGDARRLLDARGDHQHLVVVARQMSPGARVLLADHGIGWIDESGAAEVAIGSIVVSRTGRTPRPRTPSLRWTRSVLATAEALMCDTPATVSAVQAATGLSAGSSTNALRVLTDLGLLDRDTDRGPASGRRITDLDALLGAYITATAEQRHPIELVVGALWRDPVDGVRRLGAEWTAHDVGWRVSGAIASAVLAPFLTNVESALVYIDTSTMAGLQYAARTIGLDPIEGGRLTLQPCPTVTTDRFASSIDGLNVAPWPRVYADLQHAGVRGEEAAEHLREVMTGER